MKKAAPPRRPRRTPERGSATGRAPVMFSFLHAARMIEGRMEESLAGVALSAAKFAALSKLAAAEEPLTLTDLAARLTCVRSNITQLVDRLEADGLVRRVEDPKDRRSVRAELTALGRERQAAGAERMAELQHELERAFAGLDREKLDHAIGRLG